MHFDNKHYGGLINSGGIMGELYLQYDNVRNMRVNVKFAIIPAGEKSPGYFACRR